MVEKKNYCIACPKNSHLTDVFNACDYEDSPKYGLVYTVKSIACAHYPRLVLAAKAREDYEVKQKGKRVEEEQKVYAELELLKKKRQVQVWMQEHPGQGPVHADGYEEAIADLILKYPPPTFFQTGMEVEYPKQGKERKDGA